MNLWKREEPKAKKFAERNWLLGGGSWSSSSTSSSCTSLNTIGSTKRHGPNGSGYGAVLNDQAVDRGKSPPTTTQWPQSADADAWTIDQQTQKANSSNLVEKIGQNFGFQSLFTMPMNNLTNGIGNAEGEKPMPATRRTIGAAEAKPIGQLNKTSASESSPSALEQHSKSKQQQFAGIHPMGSTYNNPVGERRELANNSSEYATSARDGQAEGKLGGGEDDRDSINTEEEALDYMVAIPETDGQSVFSWRKLWAFTGPGFLMSIAYLDPGNIESDLQSGTVARYRLLWVLLMAHVLGFFLQRLSARLGVVSGRNMAEMAYEYYPKVPRLVLWIMIEIAIICSDMQEVIGTAIAFALLSNGRIPLFAGVLVTMADTFTFLLIDRYGFRKLEFIFALLISTMAITFGFEFIVVKPELLDLVEGTLLPYCPGCGQREFLQAVSVVGAVIMPHNLYLHSALVKSRRIDRNRRQNISEANLYYFIECAIALTCSFFINLFVVAVFAHGLFGKTNMDIFKMCDGTTVPGKELFPNNTETVEADIYKGGIFLGCKFGMFALYVWGVGIMAAGQSSTMTGTYAGQFVMEGFLQIKWARWRRVLFTRAIAIAPTLLVALKAQGVQNLTGMNDLLNCVQMIQLPFALLPIITFTAHRRIMFDFGSSIAGQVFALLVSLVVISINLYFSTDYILNAVGHTWLAWTLLLGPGVFYIAFVLYLMLSCLQPMGLLSPHFFDPIPWLIRRDEQLTVSAPWMCGGGQANQLSTSRDPIHEESAGGTPAYANTAFRQNAGANSSGDSL